MAAQDEVSDGGNGFADVVYELQGLEDQLREWRESDEEPPWEEQFQLIGDMIALLASTVRCPDHGATSPGQIKTELVEGEDGMQIDFEGLCCEKLERRVADRVTEFFDEAPGEIE